MSRHDISELKQPELALVCLLLVTVCFLQEKVSVSLSQSGPEYASQVNSLAEQSQRIAHLKLMALLMATVMVKPPVLPTEYLNDPLGCFEKGSVCLRPFHHRVCFVCFESHSLHYQLAGSEPYSRVKPELLKV